MRLMHFISFTKRLEEKVLSGKKTMTTRPAKGDSGFPWGHVGRVIYIKYSSQRIQITGYEKRPIQSVTEDDVKQIGQESMADFIDTWERLYKKQGLGWDTNIDAWFISFQLTDLPYIKKGKASSA